MKRRRISMAFIQVAVLIGTVMVILAVTISLFLRTYQKLLVHNTETTSRQTIAQVETIIQGYLEDIHDMIEILTRELEAPEEQRRDFVEILLKTRPDLVAVTTYDAQGQLMDCQSLEHVKKEHITCNLSFSLEKAEKMGHYISSPHVVTLFDGYYPWVVSVISPVHTAGGERWLVMDIQFRDIASYINDVGIGRHGYCFLMDKKGNIIYHPQQQLLYADLKEENTAEISVLPDGTHMKNNIIYAIRTLQSDQSLVVVGVSFVDEMITAGVQDVFGVLLLAGVLIILVSLLMSIMLSRLLARPIRRLTQAMREFEQGTDTFIYTPVRGTKEVEVLSQSFGHMVVRIQNLVETVRKEEINLRKTELRALQAQINPHFLYNTLDSIAWMCERGKNRDAVDMVNALARLFRISISRGHELIPIRSELQHAESYLQIQARRYRSQFTYEFRVDEGCLDYLCNKITLQPIIENAIYHGINGLVDEGVITISVGMEGEDILFVVEDNGNGMEPEQVAAILQKERSDRAGIGIKNVNDRLKIYFGTQYGITIHSVPDEGTRVEIRMPKVEEASEYENR